ncbi:FHA domain-containing protein [Clostridium sp. 19966]|uniref:FHA domain-containing protein n=1 Tax=Clostridium sp. 19966 TaxID=2768166 RepID=UPI0028E677A5|nr:FHA domain-containing protein [Clostridium sp. 19966]
MVDYAKLLRPIFIAVFISIIFIIIFMSLRIMYKDVNNSDKKKILRKSLGLEVEYVSENSNLKRGSIVPVGAGLTIGRKEENNVIINDPYASGHHARIYVKNNDFILEDLGSTNGTKLNGGNITDKVTVEVGDEIKIGNTVFRVIG